MPIPKTRDVGKIIGFLKREGGRPHKQIVAIALDMARRRGAKIKKKKKKKWAVLYNKVDNLTNIK